MNMFKYIWSLQPYKSFSPHLTANKQTLRSCLNKGMEAEPCPAFGGPCAKKSLEAPEIGYSSDFKKNNFGNNENKSIMINWEIKRKLAENDENGK